MELAYEERWLSLYEKPDQFPITAAQERAIRAYALEEGFETLRGFHMRLRMLDWDYYDVLKEFYK